MSNNVLNCPYCDWKIKIGVKKCKYCWEFIDKKYKTPKNKYYIWNMRSC